MKTQKYAVNQYLIESVLSKVREGESNQIANYAYTQEEINIKIGNKPPRAYFADIQAQCSSGPMKYGAIANADTLKANLAANCVPESIVDMGVEQFDEFLKRRRELMAEKVRAYYEGL